MADSDSAAATTTGVFAFFDDIFSILLVQKAGKENNE
jgi:hypothetical protein